MRRKYVWAVALVLLGSSACESTGDGGEPGLGNEGGSGGHVRCVVDQASTPAAALPLTLGQPSGESFLCPPLDEDWFRFELPGGQPLVTVELAYPAGATSPVELAYEIYRAADPSTAVAFAADEVTGDNRSSIRRSHYLGGEGGAFFVKVRDAGNDDEDPRNAYALTITASADPDGNEPNDSCAQATAIGPTGASGVLAWEGDRDAFLVPVSGSQIVDVKLRSPGPTPVDLQVTLYDADGRFLDARADSFGDDGNDVALRHGVQSMRPLCLVVADVDGDEADPATVYTLELLLADETDPNDRDVRNDTPAAATLLQNGVAATGQLLSRGDQDWFRIDAAPGDVAEVEVSCDGCDLELAVNMVYGHEGSPCEAGDSCDYLLGGTACGEGDACGSGVCRQTPEGALCGAGCGGDLDCPSFQCQRTSGVSACVGGAICVPDDGAGGSCGVVQYGMVAQPGTSQQLRWAQPVLRGPVYLLVHDFLDDEWSDGTYRVQVRLRPDPDANEAAGTLNNFYMPFTDVAELPDVLRKGRALATAAPLADVVDPDTLEVVGKTASGGGCIGFSADVDVFRLEGGNPCVEGNCAMELAFDRPAGGDLDLAWFLLDENMQVRTSLLESQQGDDRLFGDDACVGTQAVECNVYSANDTGDYFLVVYDQGLDAWDETGAHCYTWTLNAAVTPGCPAACPNVHERSGLCTCE